MCPFMLGRMLTRNKSSPSFSSQSKSAQRRPFVSLMGADVRRRGNPEPNQSAPYLRPAKAGREDWCRQAWDATGKKGVAIATLSASAELSFPSLSDFQPAEVEDRNERLDII